MNDVTDIQSQTLSLRQASRALGCRRWDISKMVGQGHLREVPMTIVKRRILREDVVALVAARAQG